MSTEQQSIFEKMESLGPERNPIFTAIEKLETDEDIKQFFSEYVTQHPDVAAQNVGYILGYYPSAIRTRWMTLLPEVYHPVFGRTVDVSAEEAFEKGLELGEKMKEERK